MATTFTRTFRVRSYELRVDGTVAHAVFLHWFQETAWEASAARGFGPEEYAAMGAAWVMRGIDVEFLQPAFYGEQVAVTTWVSDFRRVRAHREYEARRRDDDALLARGRADWVFLDLSTLTPRRLPREMLERFVTNGRPALVPLEWPGPSSGDLLGHFEATRRVQQYELDQMHHVNNAIYLNWIEQQANDAWLAWGRDPAMLRLRRHQIEYRHAAQSGDTFRLRSQAARVAASLVWYHALLRDGTVLAEARSLGAGEEVNGWGATDGVNGWNNG
ncbi:MAG: thioesterase [Ardenticatenaceae bacterium]|nr:thioesterase [Ardenticatenaceae bacterium]HBY98850.1 hypothetical protein [Chloroflexota bacterium]